MGTDSPNSVGMGGMQLDALYPTGVSGGPATGMHTLSVYLVVARQTFSNPFCCLCWAIVVVGPFSP